MNIPYPYGLNIHQLQLFEPNKGLIRFSIIIPQLQSNNPFTLIQQRLMSISRPSIINYNYLTPTKITLTLFLSIVYRLTDSSRNCPAADSPVPLLDDTSLLERKRNAARAISVSRLRDCSRIAYYNVRGTVSLLFSGRYSPLLFPR